MALDLNPLSAIGGGLLSAGAGIFASNQAANAQEEAAKQAADTQRRNMMMQLQLQEPQRNLGYQALGDLSSLYGYSQSPYTPVSQLQANLTPITAKGAAKYLKQGVSYDQLQGMGTLGALGEKAIKRLTKAGLTIDQIHGLQGMGRQQPTQGAQPAQPQAGDMSRFFTSPDYTFRRDEGQRNIGNSFAARGGAASGNALRALSQFNSNLASGEFNNYRNNLMQMAGMGTAANNQTAQAGNQYAANLGNSQMAQGDARASGIMGAANSITGAINSGFNNYYAGQYLNNMQQPQYQQPQMISPYQVQQAQQQIPKFNPNIGG
jgi:hypothetical protein